MSKKMENENVWVLMAKVLIKINEELKTIVDFDGEFLYFNGLSILVVEPENYPDIIWFYVFPMQVYSMENFNNSTAAESLKFIYSKDKNNFSDLCEWLVLFGKEKNFFYEQGIQKLIKVMK